MKSLKNLEGFRISKTKLTTIKGGIGRPVFVSRFENICGFTSRGRVIHCRPTSPAL